LGINRHQCIRLSFQDRVCRLLHSCADAAQVRNNLNEAHHGNVLHRKDGFESFGHHRFAANAADPNCAVGFLAQSAHQCCTEPIP